jgi:hypothetical protein
MPPVSPCVNRLLGRRHQGSTARVIERLKARRGNARLTLGRRAAYSATLEHAHNPPEP